MAKNKNRERKERTARSAAERGAEREGRASAPEPRDPSLPSPMDMGGRKGRQKKFGHN
ncbi:hypothetical protein [Streptomyces sp. XD-27]|uniref:hypothetical protein n=1 Tax=Streptomyces sp. XD-27 TaxID=3062779 RepID=UPI0026F4161D|nr:hypothetical protein [Streptomyces sp. XD-27]WKX69812.1 hypothetical protein Q3Y56_07725 [Streptomyces sp. XD-27]